MTILSRIIRVGIIALAMASNTVVISAFAHEGHQMKCDKTSIQAMKTDIQAMSIGEAKTVALNEMKLAEQTMAKKDTKGCEMHLSKAMEAMEK